MVPMDEWRAGLSSACLNTGCEACAHARGCERLLLPSIFLLWLFSVVAVVSFLLPTVRNVGAGEED